MLIIPTSQSLVKTGSGGLLNWHKGNRPRQHSAADYLKGSPLHKSMKRHKIKMRRKLESAIIGTAAHKIGLNDLRYYALSPLFERFEAIPQFADTIKQWRKWCAEYETRQAQGDCYRLP